MRLRELKDRSPRVVKDAARVGAHTYNRATVRGRAVPDFLVIGTKRGGTTSLFNYLLMHPGIRGINPASRGKKSTDYFFKEYHRGDLWYRAHFDSDRAKARAARRLGYRPLSGEASPYYLWDPRLVERIHGTAPQVKAIALLRDPVKRAWSHYLERRQNHVEPLTFEQALAAEPARLAGELDRMLADPAYYSQAYDWYPYRARGVYQPQLERWSAVFPADQLLVLRAEDLYRDVQGTFDVVCDFLEVERFPLPDRKAFNAAKGATDPMPETARVELAEFFAPHNAALESYLDRELGWTAPVRR